MADPVRRYDGPHARIDRPLSRKRTKRTDAKSSNRGAPLVLLLILIPAIIAGGAFAIGRLGEVRLLGRPLPTIAIDDPAASPDIPRQSGMVLVPGGRFLMGRRAAAGDALPFDAAPAHRVELSPFWLDEHEVTNAQFARFIEATGHETMAELAGQSTVFDPASNVWRTVVGADWRHPEGPATTVSGRESDPVVHVSWSDAAALAAWAGKRLPTEAEWERAARAGLHEADYPWGRDLAPSKRPRANVWQGDFPANDSADDGYHGTSPAGAFPGNRFGLFDMAGNVAEWCADWYAADGYQVSPTRDPPGARSGERRVVRGGSWISSPRSGSDYRVWVRRSLPVDAHNNYTGFRCAQDAAAADRQ